MAIKKFISNDSDLRSSIVFTFSIATYPVCYLGCLIFPVRRSIRTTFKRVPLRMKYKSTRGGSTGLSFEDALFTGYAADGGILVPETIPSVSQEQLMTWSRLGFVDLAKEITSLFVPETEIPKQELNDLIKAAFATFSVPEIAPIARLKDGLNVLELFHGRTWAFKDVALSCVGQFYNYFCTRSKKHYTILVGKASRTLVESPGLPGDLRCFLEAEPGELDIKRHKPGTSGDTGSAAIEAVRGFEWVDIIVLLPRGRCSNIQEKQMTTVLEDNVHVYRVDGTSDDLDLPIKACFMDNEFVRRHRLTSINSINWARIMVQMVHYFYSYFQMCPSLDGEVEIVVPTGACGNVASGCFARAMGLPIKLVCAVTCNDIVSRAIQNGDYTMAQEVVPTIAPAMDIQIPYNMERLWYIYSNGDTKLVSTLMEKFEKIGSVSVPKELSTKISEAVVDTYVAQDELIRDTMKKVWQNDSYLVCPHTAIAVAYHFSKVRNGQDNIPRICVATASIDKFGEAAKLAGINNGVNRRISALQEMPTRYIDMNKGEDWEKILRDKIKDIKLLK